MTFQDVFKSSFLENIASISILDHGNCHGNWLSCLACLSFLSIRKATAGVMYSASFGVTLIALSLITTLLIMTV